jgi:hypothetical protein
VVEAVEVICQPSQDRESARDRKDASKLSFGSELERITSILARPCPEAILRAIVPPRHLYLGPEG